MLVDLVVDTGRPIDARFLDRTTGRKTIITMSHQPVSADMLAATIDQHLTPFSSDNRASLRDKVSLHRVSRLLDPATNHALGLTIRLGRAVPCAIDPIHDLIVNGTASMLIVGKAGAGKTTCCVRLREC